MLTAYRRILAMPGALLFSATGLVARLPISMSALGIVLLVVDVTGSYGLAGSVAGATMIANAAASHRPGPLPRPARPAPDAAGADRDLGRGTGAADGLGPGDCPRWTTYACRRGDRAGAAVGRHLRAGPLVARARPSRPSCRRPTPWSPSSTRPSSSSGRSWSRCWPPPGIRSPASGPRSLAGVGGTLFLAAQRATEPPAHPRVEVVADRPRCRGGSSSRWRSWRWRWARCSALPR